MFYQVADDTILPVKNKFSEHTGKPESPFVPRSPFSPGNPYTTNTAAAISDIISVRKLQRWINSLRIYLNSLLFVIVNLKYSLPNL